jgi:monoamine oxidase
VKDLDAIVVGAGAAGLAASKELARAGARFVLLEARSRVGGRVRTVRPSGVPIELGAEFVHGHPPATFRELRSARLAARRVPSARAGVDGRANEHFWAELMRLIRRLDGKERDRSFAQALERLSGETPELKAAAAPFVQGFDAADLDVISARDVAEGIGQIEGAARSYRLEAGYDRLIDALLRSVPRGALKRRAVVERIEWGAHGVRVSLQGGRKFSAAAVVIALPLGVLQAPPGAPGGVRFVPALPRRKRRAIANMSMGTAARVVLLFKTGSWPELSRKIGAAFLDDRDGPFSVYWTAAPFDRPVVTAWAGGPPARALLTLRRARIVSEAVKGLARALKLPEKRLRAGLRGAFFHDWSGDPFSRGAYSYLKAGGGKAREELAEPAGPLFFAGEACDVTGESGTVAGALASGRSAAKALLAALRLEPRRTR